MKKSLVFTLIVFFLMSLNILFLPFESEARNIERVSVDNSGVQGDDHSEYPSISSDGRYVAFESDAANLVIGDTNARDDVFVSYTVSESPPGGGGGGSGGCFINTSADLNSK
jgi:hypothetical protein